MSPQLPRTISRKLTEEESPLRKKAHERDKRQWHVDMMVSMKLYFERLGRQRQSAQLLHSAPRCVTLPPYTSIKAHPREPWGPWGQQEMAEMDTLLFYALPDLPDISIQKAEPVQLPTTEDIDLSEFAPIREPIKDRMRAVLLDKYQQHDQRLPNVVKTNRLNNAALCLAGLIDLIDGRQYLKETRCLLKIDEQVGDQIICDYCEQKELQP